MSTKWRKYMETCMFHVWPTSCGLNPFSLEVHVAYHIIYCIRTNLRGTYFSQKAIKCTQQKKKSQGILTLIHHCRFCTINHVCVFPRQPLCMIPLTGSSPPTSCADAIPSPACMRLFGHGGGGSPWHPSLMISYG